MDGGVALPYGFFEIDIDGVVQRYEPDRISEFAEDDVVGQPLFGDLLEGLDHLKRHLDTFGEAGKAVRAVERETVSGPDGTPHAVTLVLVHEPEYDRIYVLVRPAGS